MLLCNHLGLCHIVLLRNRLGQAARCWNQSACIPILRDILPHSRKKSVDGFLGLLLLTIDRVGNWISSRNRWSFIRMSKRDGVEAPRTPRAKILEARES